MKLILNKKIFSIILLLSAITVFLFSILFSGKIFFIRDLTYIFHPWRSLTAQMIQNGQMPLWNPYAYCGMPLLANWQSAVFYPFSILFYIFTFSTALKIFYFVHLFFAGIFTFLFAKKNKFSSQAAAGMMIIFTFNGYLITRFEFLSALGVIIWTFAILLFVNNPVLLSISLCFSFFSGHQIFVYQIFLLLLFWIINLKKDIIKNIFYVICIFTGLSACQILPLMELIKLSSRASEGVGYGVAMVNSLKLSDVFGLISPIFTSKTLKLTGGENLQWINTIYTGFAASAAVFTGLAASNNNIKKLFAVILLILGIVFGLGDNTPVYPWLFNHLKFLNMVRYPVQYMLLAIIGVTLLSGNGIDSIKNIKIKYFVVLLITAELLIYSWDFQKTAGSDFYSNKSITADFLQKNINNERFILSPGTELNRHFKEFSIEAAWQKARGNLYSLTSLPYHLRNAYGSGEPLTLASIEKLINLAYTQKTAKDSIPYFNKMGIRYLICQNRLAVNDGFNLVLSSPVFVYESAAFAKSYIFNGDANIVLNKPGKIYLQLNSNSKSSFVWKETYYPGWELYVNNKIEKIKLYDGIFREFEIPEGETKIYQIYNPQKYAAGVYITIIFIVIITIFGIIKICAV